MAILFSQDIYERTDPSAATQGDGGLAILFSQDFYERIDPSAAPQGDGGLAIIASCEKGSSAPLAWSRGPLLKIVVLWSNHLPAR
ncbi:MAG: hypothetical protein NT027_09575 [Proteobacteria bacterium]|nr:hypothetical protein [Pseudomonadota bacterium]